MIIIITITMTMTITITITITIIIIYQIVQRTVKTNIPQFPKP